MRNSQTNVKNPQKRKNDKNAAKSIMPSVWLRTLTPSSKWPDKDEFLDVIYWARQILGIILGVFWGLIPLKGFVGLALFCIINALSLYAYATGFQKVDEEEYGGMWELIKEGFMTSFAGFLVTWIMSYSAMYYD